MAAHQLDGVLRRLRGLSAAGGVDAPSDRQLLTRFVCGKDEVAFSALIARHGPMVLGVCRRVLTDLHAAEDAFQATFLVLARRAGSIQRAELLGNWLYGTAYRVASKARVATAKRRSREQKATKRPSRDPLFEITIRDLLEVLDKELHRLPEQCRAALVACYLEEKTRDEAAAELGWSLGTLGRRLERGRELLRGRLARRGLAPALALIPAFLANMTAADIPAALTESTVKAAIGFAAGSAMAVSSSRAVTALAEGALNVMTITKPKIATVLLVAACVVAAGIGVSNRPDLVARQSEAKDEKGPTPTMWNDLALIPTPRLTRSDLLKLEGTWVLKETWYEGKVVNENLQGIIAHSKIVVNGHWLTMPHRDIRSERYRSKVTIDETAKPKRLTFDNWYGEPAHGVYTLDEDTFQFCYEHGSKTAPMKFGSERGSKNLLLIFKREPVPGDKAKPELGTAPFGEARPRPDTRRALDDAALARRIEEYSDSKKGQERAAEDRRAQAVVERFVTALVTNDAHGMFTESSLAWAAHAELIRDETALKRHLAKYRVPRVFAEGKQQIALLGSLEELEQAMGKRVPEDARKIWAEHLTGGSRIAVVIRGPMMAGLSLRRTKSDYKVSGFLFDYFPKPDDALLRAVTKDRLNPR